MRKEEQAGLEACGNAALENDDTELFGTELGKLDCIPRDSFYRTGLNYKDIAVSSWGND